MKISYFAVDVLAFVLLYLFDNQRRKTVTTAALVVIGAVLLVEAIAPGIHIAYFRDLLATATVSGGIRVDPQKLTRWILLDGTRITAVITALLALWFVRGLGRKDIVYAGMVILSSLWLLDQNGGQQIGLVALCTIPLWVENHIILLPEEGGFTSNGVSGLPRRYAVTGLIVAFTLLPSIFQRIDGMAYHLHGALTQNSLSNVPAPLRGFKVYRPQHFRSELDEVAGDGVDVAEMYAFRSQERSIALAEGEYLDTILRGIEILTTNHYLKGSVLVFDFGNPFNFILHRQPPSGDYLWYDFGRNISNQSFPEPGVLFANVDVVMIPAFPEQIDTRNFLVEQYGKYLYNHFHLAVSTKYWRVFGKQQP